MSKENVALIHSLYTAFAAGDMATVLGAFDEKIEWNEAENFPYSDGNPYIGAAAIVDGVFKRLGSEWEYWAVELEEVLDAGDSVVVMGRYKAKNRETARELDAQFAHVWWLRDGKVVRFQQYADTSQARYAHGD